jgi:hypothetical protein
MAAGTATLAEITHTSVKKIVWAWTSGVGGGDAGVCTKATTVPFDGKILGVVTIPHATAPTDDYDVTITDADGHDVLWGAGMNRDTATTEYILGSACGAVSGSTLTLNVSNAGDSKRGQVVLWIR